MKQSSKLLVRNLPILPRHVSLYDFCVSEFFDSMDPRSENWLSWNTIFKVLSGEKLSKAEAFFFDKVSGGLRYRPGKMPQNVLLVVGRKGGKSAGISRITLYHSLRFDPKILSPGQEAQNLIICPNFRTSLIDIKFAEGLLENHDALRRELIDRKQTEQIAYLALSNQITINLIPVTGVTGRGPSTLLLVLDEAAFFKRNGQFCDENIFDDARPGQSIFGEEAKYFILTSPSKKQGLVWNYYQRYFGVENDEVLVIHGACKTMNWQGKQYYGFNPKLSDAFLKKEYERLKRKTNGEQIFRREYLAEFEDTFSSSPALSKESINKCVNLHPDKSDTAGRFGVLNPAALAPGSINPAEYVAGVGHVSFETIIPDECRVWNTNPEGTTAIKQAIGMFQKYHVQKVWVHDKKVEWVRTELEEAGLEVERLPSANSLYLMLDAGLNSGNIKVPNDPDTVKQLKDLERFSSGGRGEDRIGRLADQRDDRAMMVAQMNYVGMRFRRVEGSLDDFETEQMDMNQINIGFESEDPVDLGGAM